MTVLKEKLVHIIALEQQVARLFFPKLTEELERFSKRQNRFIYVAFRLFFNLMVA
jgi:hypothetical protein